jgi:hypothetical protein
MDALKSAAVACVNKNSAVRSKSRKARRYYAGVLALLGALSLAGCYGAPLSPREKDTLIGGAVGAGGGALVGSAVGSPGAGAAIGGLGGAGLGYLIGNQVQNREYGYGGYGGYGYRYGGY